MAKSNVWMSVSDLMTGLMVIFLFVAVAYMMRANQLIKQKEDEEKTRKNDLTEYVDTKNKLHEELQKTFKEQIGNNLLSINSDLSMRFSRAETLFERGEWKVNDNFSATLQDVMPIYLNVLLHDSLRTHIKEVRIEGHTDTTPYPSLDSDPYLANLILSQRRSREVVRSIRKICAEHFNGYDQKQIEEWITAVGYSYTHALDEDGNYISESYRPISNDRSRRVEIRIITDDYRVLKEVVKE
jgi:outer membrane protein OmpA-like peptidoglycan-associated protein